MYTVYALYNKEVNKIYIGQTMNITKRLHQHNEKHGNHFTAKYQGVWELIYTESVANRSVALAREKQLKSARGRVFVKQFIKSH